MRPRLVAIASLTGAAAGFGVSLTAVAVLSSYWARTAGLQISEHPWIAIVAAYLPVICAALLTAFFIYRHTARRRKTQAIISAILVLMISVLALLLISPRLFPLHLHY